MTILSIPIAMAFVYTMGIPKLMVWIDEKMAETKKKRIDYIYASKDHETSQKIVSAKEEFKLKNIESGNKQIDELQDEIKDLKELGNKEKQDFLEQIETLKVSNTEAVEYYKVLTNQLNRNLKEAKEALEKSENEIIESKRIPIIPLRKKAPR
jgi:hypothetical protein